MKAEIVGNTKGFKPVSIQLTFQTKSELAAWLLMTNNWTVTEATVGDQLAHDIVWELHGNIKPTDAVIDHLNGDPFDNRIGNLLCKSFRHNLQNKKKYENNSSGVSGVSWTVRGTITYAVAFWNTDEGKTSKNFSVKKLGLLPAFRDAVIHRRCAIKTMNVVNGTMYTDRHGI